MTENITEKYLKFRPILLCLILVELLSFLAHLDSGINTLGFFIICLVTLILSLKNLEYGLYIVFAELFIGSKGYLFYLNINEKILSLRIALFCLVFGLWLIKFLIQWFKKIKSTKNFFSLPEGCFTFLKSKFSIFYFLFSIFLLWGLVWGIIRDNKFSNLFFDFNGWLYFALILPAYDLIKDQRQIKNILNIFLASLGVLVLQTISVLFIFSHQYLWLMKEVYRWIADFKLGEISLVSDKFYRVFLQGQIYALPAIFLGFSLYVLAPKLWKKSLAIIFFTGLIIIISFSRSYWVGLMGGIIILLFLLKILLKINWRKILTVLGILLASLILEIGFIYLIINVPKPSNIPFGSLMEKRLLENEAAGQSRMNQIAPLLKAIIKHPVLGSGFGTVITYKSMDPRQVTIINPEGWYTTYAFEWGYLDILLKIGLAGLIAYLILIGKIILKGIKIFNFQFSIFNQNPKPKTQNLSNGLILGLLLGLVALLVTNVFSPYLNHPLGIGYIIICSVIFSVLENNNMTI